MNQPIYFLDVFRYLAFALFGFCLGGILFSYHLPKLLKGVDVREASADHNPGSTNAFKYAGVPIGSLCLLCDILKGFFPVFLAMRLLDPSRLWFALIMAAPVLGHAIAPLYRCRGGKSVATTFGVFLGLLPESFLVFLLAALYILFSVALLKIGWTGGERCTILTFTLFSALAILSAFSTGRWSFCLGSVLTSVIVLVRNVQSPHVAVPEKEEPQASKQN